VKKYLLLLRRKKAKEEVEVEKNTETEGEKAKKVVYKAAYLSEWEPEAIQKFLTECASGNMDTSAGFSGLSRKPKFAAIPSEPKVVHAPSRGGEGGGKQTDGTKKGQGERVGRRADEDADGEGEGEGEGEDDDEEQELLEKEEVEDAEDDVEL